MVEIYKKSWACFRANIWAYLIFAAAPGVITSLSPALASANSAFSWLYIVFAFEIHRHFLFGEKFLVNTPKSNATGKGRGRGWFITVTLAVTLIAVIPTGFVLIRWFPALFATDNKGLATLILAGAMMPFYLIALTLFGTALPAAAAQEGFSLSATLRRTRQTAGMTFLGLLAGPGLFGLVFFVAYIGTISAVVSFGYASLFNTMAGDLTLGFILQFGMLMITTLAIATLCQAYLNTLPAVAPSAATV